MSRGYVYIMTNPSFRENWVKIGRCAEAPEKRARELYNTAVPFPFEVYAALVCDRYEKVEKLLHKMLGNVAGKRLNQNREFFNLRPEVALDIFADIAETQTDALFDPAYHVPKGFQAKPQPSKTKPSSAPKSPPKAGGLRYERPSFTFGVAGIPIGATLHFAPVAGMKVTVCDEKKVRYQGKLYSLTGFTKQFMPEAKRIPSNAYRGPDHFTYNGKTLTKWYQEREKGATSTSPKLPFTNLWAEFLAYAGKQAAFDKVFHPAQRTAWEHHWLNFSVGTKHAHTAICALRTGSARVEFYIPDNKALYDKLAQHKEAIEAELGESLLWEPLPKKKAARISLSLAKSPFDIAAQPEVFAWFCEWTLRFRTVFPRYF